MRSQILVPCLFLLAVMVFFAMPGPSGQATGTDMHCKVTSVHDGDSMRVRCPGHQKTIPVRLDQIDAPEINQAHGTKSRDYLRSVCAIGTQVVIKEPELDQYNRTLGQVYCNGVDVNAVMVKSGSAWVYDYYVRDRSLYDLQKQARSQKLGLWGNPNAVAPWKFRQQSK